MGPMQAPALAGSQSRGTVDDDDPKTIVAAGYDAIAQRYAAWGDPTQGSKGKYAELALTLASPGDHVLDLGCGTGEHVTRRLAARYAVTGVDISPRSIDIARDLLPDVTFHVADMATLDFPADSFALATAFFSLIHLPRDEHGATLTRIASWLRPGGHLLVTMSAGRGGTDVDDDWLGTRMYWSGWDRTRTSA